MVQQESKLMVADNSGAKLLKVIRVLGGYKKRFGYVGDIVTCSVKEATPRGQVKKGEVVHVVIVRSRKEVLRKDGTAVRFSENAGVVIDKKNKEPKATRIFGPVARELRGLGYNKIISLAPEVV